MITISDEEKTATLDNQIEDQRMIQRGDSINLTLDEKQQHTRAKMDERKYENPKNIVMGEWRPTVRYTERKEAKRRQGMQEEREKRREQENTVGSETLPSREVKSAIRTASQQRFDVDDPAEHSAHVNVLMEQEIEEETDGQLLGEIPELQPAGSNVSIYTRQMDPFKPARVKEILCQVTMGTDLLKDEQEELKQFITDNADCFMLTLKEVMPIPGVELNLNVPENAAFNLQMHQRPLTPEQSKFYNERANEMLTAGIIERAPPELIRCTATTVIAQRAHEAGGLSWDELKQRVNDQHRVAGKTPAFELPP
ncbi:hypothetical protein EDD22DRAFT_851104 [Suillus occidentalis]|nr:hypothetical protein EDD22DRAFT_851104 [Suillus occidentalis]